MEETQAASEVPQDGLCTSKARRPASGRGSRRDAEGEDTRKGRAGAAPPATHEKGQERKPRVTAAPDLWLPRSHDGHAPCRREARGAEGPAALGLRSVPHTERTGGSAGTVSAGEDERLHREGTGASSAVTLPGLLGTLCEEGGAGSSPQQETSDGPSKGRPQGRGRARGAGEEPAPQPGGVATNRGAQKSCPEGRSTSHWEPRKKAGRKHQQRDDRAQRTQTGSRTRWRRERAGRQTDGEPEQSPDATPHRRTDARSRQAPRDQRTHPQRRRRTQHGRPPAP